MVSSLERKGIQPSPIFYGLVVLFGITGYLCTVSFLPSQLGVFTFVIVGWIVSLVFHEFAHAFTAYRGGDRSVASKGYLTLDPRKYTDPLTSILLPSLFILMGGIALPGGAVWINRDAIRSSATESMMSLAGPFANLVFGGILFAAARAVESFNDNPDDSVLASAMTLLAFFQVLAFVLNMMPVPGLDGYGAIEPHLSNEVRAQLRPVRQYGIWIFLGLLFFVPPVRDRFFSAVLTVSELLGMDPSLRTSGNTLFYFWS